MSASGKWPTSKIFLIDFIKHRWNPSPPPFLKGGCRTSQKLSQLGGGVPKILVERADNSEKGGGVDVEMRGCHFFIALQFNCIYCVWGKRSLFHYILILQSFELTIHDSHPRLYSTKTLYHLYISDPF